MEPRDTPHTKHAANAAPAKPLSDECRRSSLAHSVWDGSFHAIMLGSGEAYFAAFAVALGAGAALVGLLASLPLLVGSLTQIVAVRLLDRVSARRPLVIGPSTAQALVWIPIVILPWLFPEQGAVLLLGGVLVYFALGSFVAPTWNSWMGDLVSPQSRGEYFGRRDRVRTLAQFVAVLLSGGVLALANRSGVEIAGFAAIFGVACLARLASVYHQTRMAEPSYRPPDPEHSFSLWDFLRRLPRSNFGRFSAFIGFMQLATFVAGPFFTLYMLRDLQFSYLEFTAASTINVLTQALTFRNWGRISDRIGCIAVLRWTGALLPVVPLMWLISPRFELILVYQAFSGFVWAGFNLSAANFLFDTVTAPKRARCVAYYNVLANAGVLAGASLGGWIAPSLPGELSILGVALPIVSNLQVLFLISGVGRLVVAIAFLPFIREVREVTRDPMRHVILQIVGLSAIRGFRFGVFGAARDAATSEDKQSASLPD